MNLDLAPEPELSGLRQRWLSRQPQATAVAGTMVWVKTAMGATLGLSVPDLTRTTVSLLWIGIGIGIDGGL